MVVKAASESKHSGAKHDHKAENSRGSADDVKDMTPKPERRQLEGKTRASADQSRTHYPNSRNTGKAELQRDNEAIQRRPLGWEQRGPCGGVTRHHRQQAQCHPMSAGAKSSLSFLRDLKVGHKASNGCGHPNSYTEDALRPEGAALTRILCPTRGVDWTEEGGPASWPGIWAGLWSVARGAPDFRAWLQGSMRPGRPCWASGSEAAMLKEAKPHRAATARRTSQRPRRAQPSRRPNPGPAM